MTAADKREILQLDLQMLPGAAGNEKINKYLDHLLEVAASRIRQEGIVLTDSVDDDNLQIMYAAYLYRNRAIADAPMSKMLRAALNNRLMSQKGCTDEG